MDEARLAVWNLRQSSGEGWASAISQLTRRLGLESGIPNSDKLPRQRHTGAAERSIFSKILFQAASPDSVKLISRSL